MRKIFLADAHLKDPLDANYRALLSFLGALPEDTDTLYLLGDLFEFWVGNTLVYPHYTELVACLKKVRGRGIRIVYFEGNHDFHLARFFTRELQAEVHTEGAVLDVGGEKAYLCHGDQLNGEDHGYRVWRRVLHSPWAAMLISLVPPRLRGRIASRLSRRSGRSHAERRIRWDYRDVIRSFARGCFASGCRVVVTGHFHLPMLEVSQGTVLLALGDWITQYSYGQWLDGEFTLETFRP